MRNKIKKFKIGITDDRNIMRCRLIIKVIRYCGAIPVLLPISMKKDDSLKDHMKKVDRLIERCDAMIFPGNRRDVRPVLYGEKNIHPETARRLPSSAPYIREEVEVRMLKYALEKQIPILGICGGTQLINVLLGGSLVQHLPDDPRTDNTQRENYHYDDNLKKLTKEQKLSFEKNFDLVLSGKKKNVFAGTHEMKVAKGSLLAKIYQENDKNVDLSNIKELSIHHQGMFKENVSSQLKITAISPDGVVEALEHKNYPKMFLLMQSHPECNASGIAVNLVQNLIDSIST